ncbi:MlaD family protein [Nocardia rhamnosiphila]|uniref:MlaD family protein n=1 Tax=Nocardia rhamnosiphila TaxID=426716 RepID=UPI0004C2E561|nr:MlaD family protein [Nocardia rhamnosiphila]
MSARRHLKATLACAIALATTTACSVGLEDIPLTPRAGGESGYTIHANFANALNLPEQAKVRLAGAEVGAVSAMTVRDYTAVVTLRIRPEVRLPVGTRAELRTATPLGDVFVSLSAPADATPATAPLHDGDSIPVESTAAAATVEELLTTASLLVNGGAIRNLTTVVNGMGRAVGNRGDRVDALLDQSTQLVIALSARSGEIQVALQETDRLAAQLAAQQSTIHDFVTAAGPTAATVDHSSQQALDLVRQIDRITTQLGKFPVLQSGPTGGLIANLNRIAAELNNAATSPDASLAALNAMLAPIIRLTSGTSTHGNVDLADFAIGAMPDPNHQADPGTHLPNAADWHAMVGSLTYTLFTLRDRVLGPR